MRINSLYNHQSNIIQNVVNMLNSKAKKKNNSTSVEQLLSALPKQAATQTNKKVFNQKTADVDNTVIAMQGGTNTQKIQAANDTSYYTKRYERTDDEVLADILSAQKNDTSKVGESTKHTSKLYTEEELAANRERFGNSIKLSESAPTVTNIAEKSDVANDFLMNVAKDIEYITNPTDRSLPSTGNLAEYSIDENGNISGANIDYTLNKISAESLVNIDCKIDDLSALHAFYKDKAKSEYSGDELDSVLSKIDEQFGCQIKKLGDLMCNGYNTADYPDGVIGSMTLESGSANSMVCSNDEENIRNSMYEIFKKRSDEYTALLNSDRFETGVSGTDNEWAEDNAEFMIHKMHQQIDTSISDIQTKNYTSVDLKAFAIMQNQYTVKGFEGDSTLLWGDYNTMNEEAIGSYIGMVGIQTKQIVNTMSLSEDAKKLLNQSYNNYIDKALEYANKKLEVIKAIHRLKIISVPLIRTEL